MPYSYHTEYDNFLISDNHQAHSDKKLKRQQLPILQFELPLHFGRQFQIMRHHHQTRALADIQFQQ